MIHTRNYQVFLGLLYPFLVLTTNLACYISAFPALPDRISIHFNTSRVPTTSLITPVFGVLMTFIILLGAVACVAVAYSKKAFVVNHHRKLSGYGGFISAVALTMMIGAIMIHSGLADWRQATGPGWWILTPAVTGMAAGFFAEYLAGKIHNAM